MRTRTKCFQLFSFCIFLLFSFSVASLLNAHNLKTPNGTTVNHSHPSDTGWGGYSQAYWTVYSDSTYNGIYDVRIARANKAYNCHAYAWASARQSNSSAWCWINTPQDNKYWNDGSYVETSQGQATHMSYGDSKDHSLVKYSGSTMTSKWGRFPAYRHQLYSDPYGASSSDTKFYRISTPSVSISGPSSAPCATGTWTANVSGGISPFTYQWYHKWECSGPPLVPCDDWVSVGSNSPTLQLNRMFIEPTVFCPIL